MVNGVENDFPLAYSAIALRSAVVRPCVIATMEPNSSACSIRWGARARSDRRSGARSTPASWQLAQCCLYSEAPSCAAAEPAENRRQARSAGATHRRPGWSRRGMRAHYTRTEWATRITKEGGHEDREEGLATPLFVANPSVLSGLDRLASASSLLRVVDELQVLAVVLRVGRIGNLHDVLSRGLCP